MFFSNRVSYCGQPYKKGIVPLLTQFENAPPCGLHTNMRVPENIVTHALQMVEDNQTITRKVKTDIFALVQTHINQTLGSNHAVKITLTSNHKVETVSMSNVKMTKIVEVFPTMVNMVCRHLFKLYYIMSLMFKVSLT